MNSISGKYEVMEVGWCSRGVREGYGVSLLKNIKS